MSCLAFTLLEQPSKVPTTLDRIRGNTPIPRTTPQAFLLLYRLTRPFPTSPSPPSPCSSNNAFRPHKKRTFIPDSPFRRQYSQGLVRKQQDQEKVSHISSEISPLSFSPLQATPASSPFPFILFTSYPTFSSISCISPSFRST